MTIQWHNRAYCDICSEYIWSEYSEHHIACSYEHVELIGSEIVKGEQGDIIEQDFILAVTDSYPDIENLIIKEWQSQ